LVESHLKSIKIMVTCEDIPNLATLAKENGGKDLEIAGLSLVLL